MTVLGNLLLLDYLARDRGHLLDDDRILSECLAPLAGRFKVVSSPESIANIRSELDLETEVTTPRLPDFTSQRVQYMQQVMSLDLNGFDDILIQSPDEVSTLYLMERYAKKRFHLIFSYNLTPARFDRHPKLAHAVMRRLLNRATTAFVHCQFEADLIQRHYPEVPRQRILVKPYHQIALPRTILDWSQKLPVILFLGPELPYKRIDPVTELIKRDTDYRYRYVFASMDHANESRYRSLEELPNVEVRYGHTPNDEYYRLFSKATCVALTHDRSFEGRLSGAFCDAVASGTAVATPNMAPYTEYFAGSGEMGVLLDSDNDLAGCDWCETLLSENLSAHYPGWQANMAALREACSMESIRAVFRDAFTR